MITKQDPQFKALIPPLAKKEYEQLEENILAEGCREPIITWSPVPDEGYCKYCYKDTEWEPHDDIVQCRECGYGVAQRESIIVDGHNRYEICQKHGIEFEEDFETLLDVESRDEVLLWMIDNQLGRRNLQPVDAVALLADKHKLVAAMAKERQGNRNDNIPLNLAECETSETRVQMAKEAGAGKDTYDKLRKVNTHGTPELVDAVRNKVASADAASKIADLPAERQVEIVARGHDEILKAAKEIRQEKAAERKAVNDKLKAETMAVPLPDNKFRTIVIDPPWEMKKIPRDVAPNQVDFDYPTMKLSEIAAFPVGAMAHEDCWLFCWTTQKYLPETFGIIAEWGFTYLATMTWHKNGGFQPFGLPQYNSEFVLVCKRGKPEFDDTKQFFLCNSWPRREHSRKPDEFYDLVSRVAPGPRIDVFSREPEGFEQYGNEVDKFEN